MSHRQMVKPVPGRWVLCVSPDAYILPKHSALQNEWAACGGMDGIQGGTCVHPSSSGVCSLLDDRTASSLSPSNTMFLFLYYWSANTASSPWRFFKQWSCAPAVLSRFSFGLGTATGNEKDYCIIVVSVLCRSF